MYVGIGQSLYSTTDDIRPQLCEPKKTSTGYPKSLFSNIKEPLGSSDSLSIKQHQALLHICIRNLQMAGDASKRGQGKRSKKDKFALGSTQRVFLSLNSLLSLSSPAEIGGPPTDFNCIQFPCMRRIYVLAERVSRQLIACNSSPLDYVLKAIRLSTTIIPHTNSIASAIVVYTGNGSRR